MRSPQPGCSTAPGPPRVGPLPTDCPDPRACHRGREPPATVTPVPLLCSCSHPQLRSPGEQGTHSPPQDNGRSASHSPRGRPAAVSCSLPDLDEVLPWPCPGPPPAPLTWVRATGRPHPVSCSRDCLSMTSWSSITLARSSPCPRAARRISMGKEA